MKSFNPKPAAARPWEAGSGPELIQGSATFVKKSTLKSALKEAKDAIRSSSLSKIDKEKALATLDAGDYRLKTIGAENAKNSVKQK